MGDKGESQDLDITAAPLMSDLQLQTLDNMLSGMGRQMQNFTFGAPYPGANEGGYSPLQFLLGRGGASFKTMGGPSGGGGSGGGGSSGEQSLSDTINEGKAKQTRFSTTESLRDMISGGNQPGGKLNPADFYFDPTATAQASSMTQALAGMPSGQASQVGANQGAPMRGMPPPPTSTAPTAGMQPPMGGVPLPLNFGGYNQARLVSPYTNLLVGPTANSFTQGFTGNFPGS